MVVLYVLAKTKIWFRSNYLRTISWSLKSLLNLVIKDYFELVIDKKNPSCEGFWVTQRHWHWEW